MTTKKKTKINNYCQGNDACVVVVWHCAFALAWGSLPPANNSGFRWISHKRASMVKLETLNSYYAVVTLQ